MTRDEFNQRWPVPFSRVWEPAWTRTLTEYAEQHFRFNEPERVGQFSLHQREYLREMLDVCGEPGVTDVVVCAGTRTGKTTWLYASTLFRLMTKATRGLYVKPTTNGPAGAKNDAKTRFLPMCRSSSSVAALIPTGALRHNFSTGQQIFLNGSILEWVGSNSVAQLASNPCQLVIQDEVDKFNSTRRKDDDGTVVEADAGDLADERTGEAQRPLRLKASTPTLASGRIWQHLLGSDLRRRFMPCPLCGRDHPRSRLVCLAWSENFTVLPTSTWWAKKLPMAYVAWDPEAKKGNGKWDFERVRKSAGYQCPHCGGRFQDEHKAWMDRNGVWLPTQRGTSGTVGFHLPSMYASHPSTTAGELAVEFLESLRSPEGPRNLINSKLAEPYAAQDISKKRVEIITTSTVSSGARMMLSVDCQAKSPYFWYVVRAFEDNESIGVAGGPLETWDDVRSVQLEHKVPDASVIIDSGWGAKDNAEVYRTCGTYGELIEDKVQQRTIHMGWTPAKAVGGRRTWRDPESKLFVPWYFRPVDLYQGTSNAGRVFGELFEFSADEFNDQLERLRFGKTSFKWTISPALDFTEYHTQLRGDVRVEKNGQLVWKQRHRHARNHLRDCEKQLVAFASAYGLLESVEEKPEEQPAEAATATA